MLLGVAPGCVKPVNDLLIMGAPWSDVLHIGLMLRRSEGQTQHRHFLFLTLYFLKEADAKSTPSYILGPTFIRHEASLSTIF